MEIIASLHVAAEQESIIQKVRLIPKNNMFMLMAGHL